MRQNLQGMLVCVLWVCVICSRVGAQVPEESIAIVFDTESLEGYDMTPPVAVVDAYLIIHNPTDSEIYGFEVAIRSVDGDLNLEILNIANGGENSLSGQELSVAFETPLATAEITVLAQLQFVVIDPDECLYLTGVSSPSLDSDLPLIWSSPASPRTIEQFQLFPNGVNAVVAGWENPILIYVDPPCSFVVSASSVSWGALKSTFR